MKQDEFWQSFVGVSKTLASRLMQGETQAVFDELCSLAESNGIDFCFDITSDDVDGHLIFSPEGDYALAQQIDSFLAAAPEVPGWKLFGRRQRRALDDARMMILQFYSMDPQDFRFHIVEEADRIIVQISLPGDPHGYTSGEKIGLADTFLWHAIGEDLVMERNIQGVILVNASHCSKSAEDLIFELTGEQVY